MNKKYIPNSLNVYDKRKQKHELMKSIKMYKKNKYYTRKSMKSFRSKPSKHLKKVKTMYNIEPLLINKELIKKTGCSRKILNKIVNKGMGAYYSSGSRPNQTAKSWGMARLASAITGGPASKVDAHLLKHCSFPLKNHK